MRFGHKNCDFGEGYEEGMKAAYAEIDKILANCHSHDPGLCGDVAYYTNAGIESEECLYLDRIRIALIKGENE